jgi:tetratricopeptide (TPR) repeat protein
LKRKKPQKIHSPPLREKTGSPIPDSSASAPGRTRFWFFRMAAVVGIPILLFAAVEGGLRLAGFGHPTAFFKKSERNGHKVHVDNVKFGFRFFPPGMARSPSPIVMPAEKPPHTFRIFVFGESAALGDPKPAYGFSRSLQLLLNERHPELQFEVVCVAMTAINSHAIRQIARECRNYQGDFWVVYMGNNELMGRFGAAGPLGPRTSNLLTVRAGLALKRTRFGQLLEAAGRQLAGQGTPGSWRGLRQVAGHLIAPDDPIRSMVEEHFTRNLKDILNLGAKSGATTVLCTVAANLGHCAPHASIHSPALTQSGRTAWDDAYETGIKAESSGDFSQALRAYLQAGQWDDQHAELQFRIARSYQSLGNRAEARARYEAARDHDALPFRITSRLNRIIRSAAAEYQDRGVKFLDVENLMAEAAPNGIPGNDLFVDHVHYNFEGNYILARAVAQEIASLLPGSPAARDDWLSPFDCEMRLGLTAWNRYLIYENMLGRLAEAPYTNQLDNLDTRRRHAQNLSELRRHIKESDPKHAAAIYEEALAPAPEDYFLLQNYAEFLELSGKLAEATARWKEVARLIPHHPVAYFHSGRLLVRQNQFKEAEEELSRALAIRSHFPEAWLELGKSLAGRGRHEDALNLFAKGLRLDPENAGGHFHTAESLAALERRDEAMEHLREAIRFLPGYWEARYLLGVEHALRDEVEEAMRQFQEVTRLRPGYAAAHFNLGVALAKNGRLQEAALEFHKTLQLDPGHNAAQEYLQALLSRRNQPDRQDLRSPDTD